MPYFIHLIMKMSRILQPTIIKINEIHHVFSKKIPNNEEQLKPNLLSKYLFNKIIKPIKLEDKIIVLGITNEPWKAKFNQIKKCFEKVLLIPKNDYATTFLIWQKNTLSMFGIPKQFEFSALAKVTSKYKTGEIIQNIQNTCNLRRRMQFSTKPLKHIEFIETFLKENPPRFPSSDKVRTFFFYLIL